MNKLSKKLSILIALTLMLCITTPDFLPFVSTNIVMASTITIDKKELTLTVGDTYKLKISGTKSTVAWSSSKKSVATVSKWGTITAIKEGIATITATVNNKKYTCKVTVINPHIYPETVSLSEGETQQLELKGIRSDSFIKWSSGDKSVATIDSDGEVTAISEGTITITATANKKEYSCLVTVKKTLILVTDIITTCNSVTIPVKSQVAFNATPYPTTASNKALQWKSSDETIVKVDAEGECLAMKEGIAEIYAYATDGSNVFAKWEIIVANDFSKRITTDSQDITMNLSETKIIFLDLAGYIMGETIYCQQSNIILAQKWSNENLSIIISPYKMGITYLTFTSNYYPGEYKIKVTVVDTLTTPTPAASTLTPTAPTPTPTAPTPTPSVTDNSAEISSLQSQISSAQSLLISYQSSLKQYQSSLANAQYKLSRAQSQKTLMIYREGQGFVYEADPDAVRAAQDNVDYYQSLVDKYTGLVASEEQLIASLQAELDSLK